MVPSLLVDEASAISITAFWMVSLAWASVRMADLNRSVVYRSLTAVLFWHSHW